MDKVIIENVRCFQGRHEVPLAPVTLLVGENSTGKSTFLAAARRAWDVMAGKPDLFNEEPFLWGAYDQIAARGPSSLRAGSFRIGCAAGAATVIGEFVGYWGQPFLKSWSFESPNGWIRLEYSTEKGLRRLTLSSPSGEAEILPSDLGFSHNYLNPRLAVDVLIPSLASDRPGDALHETFDDMLTISGPRPYAFAPIRSHPQRTYDPIKPIENPEGSHVPMLLATTYSGDEPTWNLLKANIDAFGKASGLFGNVQVRRMGGTGDPFQIQVEVDGILANFADIGYGVSQILPVIVDCIKTQDSRTFLLQQPEVHLHPKAQAELGSFLATLAMRQEKRFLIETHSDHIIDRIRMDVRDKKHGLRPEDVALLYFERKAGAVQVHRLLLDELGNITNPPPGYRDFFLNEEMRLLGG